MVTPTLFTRYPSSAQLAKAKISDVEHIIKSLGLFRNKAKSIVGCAGFLQEHFNGEIPHTIDEMIKLPGVGRKTANVVLGNAFNLNFGIAVDTHVSRLSKRLKLADGTPEQIEKILMKIFPTDQWSMVSHLLIWHGRKVCFARKPECSHCTLNKLCPSAESGQSK